MKRVHKIVSKDFKYDILWSFSQILGLKLEKMVENPQKSLKKVRPCYFFYVIVP